MKKWLKTNLNRFLTVLIMAELLVSQFSPVIEARAAANLTVTPVTWNIIGLDSNKVTVGPNLFPIGARVCNTGDATATNVTSAFVFDDGQNLYSGNTYINLRTGSLSAYTAAGINLAPNTCTDFYYEVEVKRDSNAYKKTRHYHITASANSGAITGSTATPRELFVEYLVSQSRNAVTGIEIDGVSIPAGGTMSLIVGNTYTIKLTGFTATQGYNQLESFINLPNAIFQILTVSSKFSAPSANYTIDKLYSDACGWDNLLASPTYRSCIVSDDKAGGDVELTYTVKILSTGGGGAKTLSTLLYDFSGSSFHYNSDFGVTTRSVELIDPAASVTISKAFSPSTIPAGGSTTLTVTLSNSSSITVGNANFSDSLPSSPAQMVVATPATYSTSGCGSAIFTPVAGATSFSVSGATLAPNGSCVISLSVSVPASPTSGTYSNQITNFKIGTAPVTGISSNTASLTVSAASGSSGSGLCGQELAVWTFSGAALGALTTPYSANSPSGSTDALTVGNGLSVEGDTSSGNAQPSALLYGWQKNSPIAPATSDYLQLALNTDGKTGVKLQLDAQRKSNGPSTSSLYYSMDGGGTWNLKTTFSTTTSWATYPTASTYFDFTGQTKTDGVTYFRIYGYGANAETKGADINIDNIRFTGCGAASAPTITKTFNTNPVAKDGSSTLTFALSNPNSSALNGVSFSDVLPSGLSFASNSTSSVCGGTLTITASSGTISFSGGVLSASTTCSISTPAITASTSGPHSNITGFISSTESGTNATSTGSARASLVALLPPVIEKVFSPNPILTGETSTLTFVISNPNPSNELPAVAFSDSFPTSPGAMVVASPVVKSVSGCGGSTSFSPNAGDASISFSNGTIAAGGTCTVSIKVKVPSTAGSYANTSGAVTTTVGGVTTGTDTASSTLVANLPNPAFSFRKQISASSSGPWSSFLTLAPASTVYYKFTLENTGDVPLTLTGPVVADAKVSLGSCSWPSTLPVASPTSDPTTTCTVSATAAAGDHPNIAQAIAYYGSTPYTVVSDATYYGVNPGGLNLSKQVSTSASGPWTTSNTGITPGADLYYRFVAINKTGLTLSSVTLTDDKIASQVLNTCTLTSPLEDGSATSCVVGPVAAVSSGSGAQTNTASVSGVNGGNTYTSPNASASYALAAPSLSLEKSNNNLTVTKGGTTSYTLDVSNTGNLATSGTMTVIDKLPTGMTVSDGTVSLGDDNAASWSCTASSNVLTCTSTVGYSIAAGGVSKFSFITSIDNSLTIGATLANKAQVGGGGTGVTASAGTADTCTAANSPAQGCAVDSDTVTANALPVAIDDSASATAGIAKNIYVLSNDTQLGDPPTSIQSGTISTPGKGTAVYNNNGTASDKTDDYIVYTPNISASGTDTFTYEICDSTSTPDCDTATVTVTINPVPVAVDDSASATAGVAKNINVLTNDTQLGDTPTSIQSGTLSTPGKGTAVYNNNGTASDKTDDYIVYTPYLSASGTDTFTYEICDSTSTPDCDTATVTVTINPVPVAVDDSAAAKAGVAKNIYVLSNDTQLGDTPTSIQSGTLSTPSQGTAVYNNNGTASDKTDDYIVYTPNANATGTDTFTYEICDSTSTPDCDTATVTVTLNSVPDAINDTATATAGVAKNIDVLSNDTPLGDTPTSIQSGTLSTPGKGTAVLNNNGTPSNPADDYIVYTPNANATGTDTFTYEICDSTSTPDCDTATVTVTINLVPVAVDDSASATAGVAKNIYVLSNDTQLGDIPTSIQSGTISTPSKGTAVYNNNGTASDKTDDYIVYTPNANATGTDTFTYEICDSSSTPDCDTATVTVTMPAMTITKSVSSSIATPSWQSSLTGLTAGDAVYFRVQLTSNYSLTGVTVDDSICTLVGPSGDDNVDGILDSGETWTYGCEVKAAYNSGSAVTNTATGESDQTGPVTDTASYTVPNSPTTPTPTVTPAPNGKGTISGRMFADANSDGLLQSGEGAISTAVTIHLLDINNNDIAQTTTDLSGLYSFTNVDEGTYTVVQESDPPGYLSTSANTVKNVSVTVGSITVVNFGEYLVPQSVTYSITGYSWHDANADAVFDLSEDPIENQVINLYRSGDAIGSPYKTTQTDASGLFSFTGLSAGTYSVKEEDSLPYIYSSTINYKTTIVGPAEFAMEGGGLSLIRNEFGSPVIVPALQSGSSGLKFGNFAPNKTCPFGADPIVDTGSGSYPSSVKVGDPYFMSFEVGNNGNIDANNVQASMSVPSYLEVTSVNVKYVSLIGGGSKSYTDNSSGNTVALDLGDVSNSDVFAVQVSALVKSDPGSGSKNLSVSISHNASGKPTCADISGNNSGNFQFSILGTAGLNTLTGRLAPNTGFKPGAITRLPEQPQEPSIIPAADKVTLKIPNLNVNTTIVGIPFSNNWDVTWLGGNVGWLQGSSYMGGGGNSVLVGHNYLASGEKGPFINLGWLQKNDLIYVEQGGEQQVYRVDDVLVVTADSPLIFQHFRNSTLTLVTCRDYDERSGTYRKRLIVRARLMEVKTVQDWSTFDNFMAAFGIFLPKPGF